MIGNIINQKNNSSGSKKQTTVVNFYMEDLGVSKWEDVTNEIVVNYIVSLKLEEEKDKNYIYKLRLTLFYSFGKHLLTGCAYLQEVLCIISSQFIRIISCFYISAIKRTGFYSNFIEDTYIDVATVKLLK